MMRRLLTALALAGTLLHSGAQSAAAQPELEARVKAAFLYNFVKFVEWPASKFGALNSPIELCVHADKDFGEVLRQTVQGKTAQGRPLVVHIGQPVRNPASCHLLYAGGEDATDIGRTFSEIIDDSVLSVHAADKVLPDGIVRFYIADNKVRIEINASAAERTDLKLSSKLQSVATIVRR